VSHRWFRWQLSSWAFAFLAAAGPWAAEESKKAKEPAKSKPKETDGKAAQETADPVEQAIRLALDWLRRHQDPDGGWKAAGYQERCKQPCLNENQAFYGDGRGDTHYDPGVTGLAMLAIVRCGRASKTGLGEEDREALRRATQYLAKIQLTSGKPDVKGRYGPTTSEHWIYNHAIATLAMAESLDALRDEQEIRPSVTSAVQFCLLSQNPGLGWRYGVRAGDNDTSVTAWMVQALHAAKEAKLAGAKDKLTKSFKGVLDWVNRATHSSGKTGYWTPGDEGSRLNKVFPEPFPFSKRGSSMTGAGILTRLLAGEKPSATMVQAGIDLLLEEKPAWREPKGQFKSTINFYYWYYGSQALSRVGGQPWESWKPDLERALLRGQRRGDACAAGSWDPIDEWGPAGGRVYSTALAAMELALLLPDKGGKARKK
jgi:hypothetical protein